MTYLPASIGDIILLSACAFLGNIGKAVTGFGMAIIFLFVWNIADLAGYEGSFKFAVFVQSLALFSVQPLAIYNAEVAKYAHRHILLLFIPITLLSTPLGQLLSESIPTKTVQTVAGVLVALVAVWELYDKRHFFWSLCQKKVDGEEEGEEKAEGGERAQHGEGPTHNTSAHINMVDEDPTAKPIDDEGVEVGVPVVAAKKEAAATITSAQGDDKDELKIGLNKATFVTLLAGGASGFLGGMVAIRGPPLILYFLHPPRPVSFDKHTQRATATVIAFFNVLMRQAFYLYTTFSDSVDIGYHADDWPLYLSVILCSIAGAMVGNWMFTYLKDSKDTIRAILAVFLLLCGAGLLFSAFR